MRHAKKHNKLGTDAEHRDAIMRGLAAEVLRHERVKTTHTKAKQVRSVVDGLITLGKKGDLSSRRRALSMLGDRDLVHKVFADIAPRYEERNGGYTRILKLGPRQGDAAPMALIELV